MDADLLILLGALAAWTCAAFWLGRWVERRHHREAGASEPPTARQLLFLDHLADEAGMGRPPVRTRIEAAAAINDLIEERRLREARE